MPTIPLTEVALRNLKPGPKAYRKADGGGMYVQVEPSGSKLWRLAYRFDGKQKSLALGAYPAVGLQDARRKRDAAKGLLDQGVDPGVEKKARKREAEVANADDSFGALAREWFISRADVTPEALMSKQRGVGPASPWTTAYARRVWPRLAEDAKAIWADDVKAIEPPAILALLRVVEQRGAIEMAKRIKGYVSEVFQYALATGRGFRDPTKDVTKALRPKPPVKHRKALKAAEMPEFLCRLDRLDSGQSTRLGLALTVQTLVRTSETRFAHVDEFEDLDGPEPLWRLSPERMKMRNEHLVPLSPQAVATVKAAMVAPAFQTRGDGLLFPGESLSGALSENAMLYALYRLGYHGKATVHGFRATGSTALNESGLFEADWIERQLAHVDQDEVRASYNAALYLPQRRRMMCWWADRLDAWRAQGKAAES